MTMHSPELLLKSLNKALRRLRGACTVLDNEEFDDKLLGVMRRLLLAEILGDTWIVAIGGSQGAGKTTLMTSMYDLRGQGQQWLQGNEGRGEKMPVLVKEVDDLAKPQGYVRRLVADDSSNSFKLKDVQVDVPEFQQAVCDPNAEDLLPVLRVPRRYFKRDKQAWLLLPGYEKQERANRSWQELMRQAMIGAGGCIIVTDETRMANQQQLEIVKDMLQNELRNCKPYIVISKTEAHRHNEKRCADLRASAQEIFQIEPELADKHIILSGADDPTYIETWMPHLRSAIDDLNFNGQSNRYLQISHLSTIVSKDLSRVLNEIKNKSRLYFNDPNGSGEAAEVLEEILEKYDDAVENLRQQHHEKLNTIANAAYSSAAKSMNKRLQADHEGFMNWLTSVFDTTSKTKEKMQELVKGSWQEVAPAYFSNYSKLLSEITSNQLGKSSDDYGDESQKYLPLEQSQKLIELGYVHSSGKIASYSNLKGKVSDIRALLGDSSQKEEEAGNQEFSKRLSESVALLPAIALEYSRLTFHMPQACGINPDYSAPAGTGTNLVTEGLKNIQTGLALGKTAMQSIAAAIAVDVVSDGDSDILGVLFGSNTSDSDSEPTKDTPPPLVMPPAAIAAIAVVSAAYITSVAVTHLRTIERRASTQAHSMLLDVRDNHVKHLKSHFDEIMGAVRERLKAKIRNRYRMDEALMRKDRLAVALADVSTITNDLLYELNSSPNELQPFLSNGDI